MRHSSRVPLVAGLLALSTSVLLSQEPVDLGVVDRIKDEAFARSEVMDHLRNLTDVHGPRLTGSPEFEEAAQWAVERLSEYGVSNVHVERWGPFGRSWSVEAFSAEQLGPHYARLTAMPWPGAPRHRAPCPASRSHPARHVVRERRPEKDRRALRRVPPAMERQAARPDPPPVAAQAGTAAREAAVREGDRRKSSPRSPPHPNRGRCCACRNWTTWNGRRSRKRGSRRSWRCRRR